MLIDTLSVVPVERIAFIGWSNRLERVLHALEHEMGNFQQIVGYFHETDKPELETSSQNKYPPLAKFDQIEKVLNSEEVSLLILEESSISLKQLQKLGEICSRSIVNFKVIPSAFDVWSTKLNLRVVAGIPLLGVYDLRYDRLHNRIAKRTVDIAGALFGLAVSAPIIAILAILIKRESPGTIFFRQKRLGQYGKPFEIIKLRSMKLDAEAQSGAVWAVQDDPRRLKIGAFMRKWNLDELPQFWNVLKGDMSMVVLDRKGPSLSKDLRRQFAITTCGIPANRESPGGQRFMVFAGTLLWKTVSNTIFIILKTGASGWTFRLCS